MEKKKEKGFGSGGPGGRNPAQPGAGARARRPSHGPRRETARAHERRCRFHGAHALGRAGGGDGVSG
jgi:hypothetical protein